MTDAIQVDPEFNPDYVMSPGDEGPRLATAKEREALGLPPVVSHVHEIPPGDNCPTCSRRVPFPKAATSPSTKPLAYRIPMDEYDAHLEVIDAVADLLGVTGEKYHRYRTMSYCLAAVLLHGLRLDEEIDGGDWCVRCGTEAAHTHHRKLRSQGGDDSPANLIRLCVDCHGWVHAEPALAYATGYLVKSWQDPAKVPVG